MRMTEQYSMIIHVYQKVQLYELIKYVVLYLFLPTFFHLFNCYRFSSLQRIISLLSGHQVHLRDAFRTYKWLPCKYKKIQSLKQVFQCRIPSLIHLAPLLYIILMKENRYQNVFIEQIGIRHHVGCVSNIISCMVCTIQQMTLKCLLQWSQTNFEVVSSQVTAR